MGFSSEIASIEEARIYYPKLKKRYRRLFLLDMTLWGAYSLFGLFHLVIAVIESRSVVYHLSIGTSVVIVACLGIWANCLLRKGEAKGESLSWFATVFVPLLQVIGWGILIWWIARQIGAPPFSALPVLVVPSFYLFFLFGSYRAIYHIAVRGHVKLFIVGRKELANRIKVDL